MRAHEVFGIVVRILGVICLVRSALDASVALSLATAVPAAGTISTLPLSMAVSRSLTYLVIGLLLLFGTRMVVRLAYEKEQ
jgi:hypothetical protein